MIDGKNIEKRKIVAIIGSSKFKKAMITKSDELIKKGFTVLPLGSFNRKLTDEQSKHFDKEFKEQLIESHYHKILLCDIVYLVNPKGYIGEHTKNDLLFAKKKHKILDYDKEFCRECGSHRLRSNDEYDWIDGDGYDYYYCKKCGYSWKFYIPR